jgi:hypothetical protein
MTFFPSSHFWRDLPIMNLLPQNRRMSKASYIQILKYLYLTGQVSLAMRCVFCCFCKAVPSWCVFIAFIRVVSFGFCGFYIVICFILSFLRHTEAVAKSELVLVLTCRIWWLLFYIKCPQFMQSSCGVQDFHGNKAVFCLKGCHVIVRL